MLKVAVEGGDTASGSSGRRRKWSRLVHVVQVVVQVGRSLEVTEIKLYFISHGNQAYPLTHRVRHWFEFNVLPRSSTTQLHASSPGQIHHLRDPHTPSPWLLGNFTTLKLPSCAPSSSRPSHCYLQFPRQFYHPQAPKLCALELCALELWAPHVVNHELPSQSTTLKLSSYAPSSSKPSIMLPSTFSAILPPSGPELCILELHDVRPRAPSPPHCYLRPSRRFYHPKAPKLCALELHALRIATLVLQALHIVTLKLPSPLLCHP
jgi:hypothetical protein